MNYIKEYGLKRSGTNYLMFKGADVKIENIMSSKKKFNIDYYKNREYFKELSDEQIRLIYRLLINIEKI